jgi:hypothetical protein
MTDIYLKNAVFRDVMPCGVKLVTANVVPGSLILVTLVMEEPSSSEMSVPTRATLRNIPENAIFHSHHRENFKSYIGKRYQ